MKCFGYRPDILAAAFDELKKQGMRSACHHAQLDVARVNVLTTARWGLTTMEHWYGLPEALFDDAPCRTTRPATTTTTSSTASARPAGCGRRRREPGSDALRSGDRANCSRSTSRSIRHSRIYRPSRDLMRARRADWHDEYTLPSLWDFFTPNRDNHGSFFFDWGTEDEVAWRDNYRRWMAFVNDYKNRGGRVTVG